VKIRGQESEKCLIKRIQTMGSRMRACERVREFRGKNLLRKNAGFFKKIMTFLLK